MTHRPLHKGTLGLNTAKVYDENFPTSQGPDDPGPATAYNSEGQAIRSGSGSNEPGRVFQGDAVFFTDNQGQLWAVDAATPGSTPVLIPGINLLDPTVNPDLDLTVAQQIAEQMSAQVRALTGAFPELGAQAAMQQVMVNLGLIPSSAGPFANQGGPPVVSARDQAAIREIDASIAIARQSLDLARSQGDEELAQRWTDTLGNLDARRRELAESSRATDIGADLERENLGLIRRGQDINLATEAARMGFDRDKLAAEIGAGNADRLLNLAIAEGDIRTQNAIRRFQGAESQRERAIALTELRAIDSRDRQRIRTDLFAEERATIQQLAQAAADPGDRGLLAGILAAGTAGGAGDPFSSLLGAGGDAISDESAAPTGGFLSLLDRIRQAQIEAVQPSDSSLDDLITSQSPTEDVQLDIDPASLTVPVPGGSGGGIGDREAFLAARETSAANALAFNELITGGGSASVTPVEAPDSFGGTTTDVSAGSLGTGRELDINNIEDFGSGPASQAATDFFGADLINRLRDAGLEGFAGGGTIEAGDVGVVGEAMEPELFINNPDGSTTIIPFSDLQGFQDGGFLNPEGGSLEGKFDEVGTAVDGGTLIRPTDGGPILVVNRDGTTRIATRADFPETPIVKTFAREDIRQRPQPGVASQTPVSTTPAPAPTPPTTDVLGRPITGPHSAAGVATPAPPPESSEDFLARVSALARKGTPFENTPGKVRPIQFAAPGSSSLLQRLGASIVATESGIPKEATNEFLERQRLPGLNAGAVSARTA